MMFWNMFRFILNFHDQTRSFLKVQWWLTENFELNLKCTEKYVSELEGDDLH